MTFLAEVDADDDRESVHFRYIIDGSAALTMSREWWEQLGKPETVEISASS